MKIQFTVKVHSDRDIQKPERFFRGVFETHSPTWTLVGTEGQTMTAKSREFEVTPDFDPVMLFDSITPMMYDGNMERSYRVVA